MKVRLICDRLPITGLVFLGIIALGAPFLASFTDSMTDRLFFDSDARGEAGLAIPDISGDPPKFLSDIDRLLQRLGW